MPPFSFHFNDFAFSFLSILLEGIPFLLLGSLISGAVDVFVSSERLARLLPRNSTVAVLLSGLLGLIFPMCECGSVVVIRRFIRKGLPLASAVSYMLAAPIVSPLVALSTFAAFKGQNPILMTSLRVAIGYAIAVGIAFIVRQIRPERLLQDGLAAGPAAPSRAGLRTATEPAAADFSDIAASASLRRKSLLVVQSATSDFLDVTFFFVIGAALTSVFNTAVNQQEVILPYAANPVTAIVALMGLAGILALCSTTDAFIAASLASFPMAAKLAFLLFGPLFDLKLFWLYGVIFKRRFVALLGLSLFVTIGLISWRIHATGVFD